MHCAAPAAAMDRLNRPAKDIDFLVPKGDRKAMRTFLESRGYVVDRDLLVAMEGMRYSFTQPDRQIEIDIFVERLQFNHTIDVVERFDRHSVTIPIEELLLQKLQIVSLTVTDLLDLQVLLATHPIGPGSVDAEQIDSDHIATIMSKDWGFQHTVVKNLTQLRDAVGAEAGLGKEANDNIRDRIDILLLAIELRPKSLSWRMRAKVGERVQWWEDVDDRVATY